MILYVSSVETGAIERSPGFLFHSCDLKKVQNFTAYAEEDQKAIEFLDERGIHYELVDLSKCAMTVKLKAKLNGINRTPTLVLDNGTKLDGILQIEQSELGR